MNLSVVQRTGYTLLDVLSDVGGLQGILLSGIVLFLSIVNYGYLDSYLVSKTFKYDDVNELKTSQFENLQAACIGILPKKVSCCMKSRKQIAMAKASEKIKKEVDIIKII